MDVFDLDKTVIDRYKAFARSFTNIRSPELNAKVDELYAAKRFWPEPLIQLNPHYAGGGSIQDFIDAGDLEPECAEVFRDLSVSGSDRDRTLKLRKHQQQAVGYVAGQPLDFRIPQHAPAIFAGILPVRGGKLGRGHGLAGGGTDQADPGLDPAVLEHPRRRGQDHGGALRAGVDDGTPVPHGERIVGRQRHEPVAADDLDKLGGGARGFMNVNRLARGHGEGVGPDGLDTLLVGPGLDGLFDVGLDAGSSSANNSFCSAMGRASSRLRNRGIGGRSSLSEPSQINFSPVASSKRSMDQPAMLPRHSAM